MTFIIGVAVVVAVAMVDLALAWRWSPGYFTFGIPVFRRRIEIRGSLVNAPLEEVEAKSRTAAAAPLAFRRMAPDVVAFRERGVSQYIPIMRGVIRQDSAEATATVTGLLNWFVVAAAIVLVVELGKHVGIVAGYFFAVLGILYFLQAVRYNRVAKHLRTLSA